MMEKKKKKTKYQPLDISMTVVKASSWAEDETATFGGISDISAIREKLPSAPKAVRNAYDVSQLPSTGPWKAKVNNLSFNVKQEDVIKFLGGDDVQTIDIPYNGSRMRGYAIATFVSREALANALSKNDDMLMNRRVSVNLLNDEGQASYPDSGGNVWGRDRESRRPIREDDEGDWRSSAIQSREQTIGRQERSSPANGDWSRGQSRRPWQEEDPRPTRRFDGRSSGYDRHDLGDRDGGSRREWNRDSDRSDYRERDRRERPSNFERDSRDRPSDYSEDRGRRDDRGFERPEPMRERPEPMRERPRLNLQPRSKPIDVSESKENGKDLPRPSIFGGARPVDTASKEREIESRLLERDKALSTEHSRRRPLSSQSSLNEKDDVPQGRNFRSRKTSDSSGKGSNMSSIRHGNDSDPTPPDRSGNETSGNAFSESTASTGRRQAKLQPGCEDEDNIGEGKNRSATTSGDSSQPTVQVVDAPPPTVNVWQVRRSQMQKRAEAAAAATTTTEPESTVRGSVSMNNSSSSAAATSQMVPGKTDESANESSTVVKQLTPATEDHSSNASKDNTIDNEESGDKGERTHTAPSQQQPRRPPVVVSVSLAQRAAAEGQPPPPPLHVSAWQQNTQGGIDSVRRPPSPHRTCSGNQPTYTDRSYSYHHPHSNHEWQESPRRNDYRDGGSFRGQGYGSGRSRGWRGRGSRGTYRGSRGRGNYRYGGGMSGDPNSSDM